jgi:phosphoribosylformimino-5-aminoimidazole carboxamide ribotide isomerase
VILLYPAIDIRGGRAVRLTRGDFDREKAYADDPLDAARRWVSEGARALHVVDLDGAREGRPVSLDHLRRIAAAVDVPVQWGGGLRALEHVEQALDAGAGRAILGTAAYTDQELLDRALERFGDRIAVAVDVRGGRIATGGWLDPGEVTGTDAIALLRRRGVTSFVYTSIDRDGMMSGLDVDELQVASGAVGEDTFLYSGGIGSLDDLALLSNLGLPNCAGTIVGKALYEERFTVAEAQAALG